MASMDSYSKAAVERAMKVQEVILRAMAKKITWWQAAEIIGISDRSIATLAQTKGNVKDVQGILGHSNPDITAGVYLQTIEEGVKQTLDAIYTELTAGPRLVAVV